MTAEGIWIREVLGRERRDKPYQSCNMGKGVGEDETNSDTARGSSVRLGVFHIQTSQGRIWKISGRNDYRISEGKGWVKE